MKSNRRILAALGLGMAALASPAVAASSIDCVRVEIPELRIVPDRECQITEHPLAERFLADLEPDGATPAPAGPCHTIGPTTIRFIDGAGRITEAVMTAVSAETVGLGGGRVAPLPIPLFDLASNLRVLSPFTAASVIEVSTTTGKSLGQLVTRDTGWVEIDESVNAPSFISDRFVVTQGAGRLLRGVRGEIIANGDGFVAGAAGAGSLCGGSLPARLDKHAR
jgi:hypothetical protein